MVFRPRRSPRWCMPSARSRRTKGLGAGFRVISNKGADAGQTVMHFHIHVLGGEPLGENLI